MRSRELNRMLAEALKLTPGQWQELMKALSGTDEVARVVQTVQSRPLVCPHCQSERVVGNGHASGLQRYKCRNCDRTFNALADTPRARLWHKGKWERQAEVLRQGLSVHQAAETLSVAPSTAFRWRHRVGASASPGRCAVHGLQWLARSGRQASGRRAPRAESRQR